jgi:glucose-6-phosphate 1-dehydrogenase
MSNNRQADLIVRHIDWLITVDPKRRIIRDAALVIQDGKFAAIGKTDEIERSWAIIEPFIHAAESEKAPNPEEYIVGSMGPVGADGFMDRNLREWLPLYGNRTT